MKKNLKVDLKHLAKSQLVEPVSKQLKQYEKKATRLAKEFDLKSKEARQKGKARVDEFVTHLNQTRDKVEKQAKKLMEVETKRLNQKVNRLLASLKSASKQETKKTKKKTSKKSRKTSRKPARKKTTKTSPSTAGMPSKASQELQETVS